jgi:pheromone a factor receptor
MATVVLLILLPVETYILISHAIDHSLGPLHPYSWSLVHDDWNVTIFLSSKIVPVYWNRYGWIVYGYIVFAFFGLGEDARRMYADWSVYLGLGRVFPSLVGTSSSLEGKGSRSSSTWFGSVSSKAKPLLNKQGSKVDSTYVFPPVVHLVYTDISPA